MFVNQTLKDRYFALAVGVLGGLLASALFLFALSISASAQSLTDEIPHISGNPAILVTTAENGKPTDDLASVLLDFGTLYLVTYAQNIDIRVNVPDRNGKLITTGSVVLRADGKSFPATYAGPAPFFPNFQQVNIQIPRDEFPAGATVYLRICDQAGNCKNSTGATIRVAQ